MVPNHFDENGQSTIPRKLTGFLLQVKTSEGPGGVRVARLCSTTLGALGLFLLPVFHSWKNVWQLILIERSKCHIMFQVLFVVFGFACFVLFFFLLFFIDLTFITSKNVCLIYQ